MFWLSFLFAIILLFIGFSSRKVVKSKSFSLFSLIFFLPFFLSIFGFFFYFNINVFSTLENRVSYSNFYNIFLILTLFFLFIAIQINIFRVLLITTKDVYMPRYSHDISRSIATVHYKNTLFLFLLISLLYIIIQYFSFEFKIGLTGIEPIRLPFKLTGLLFYLTKFILPIFLAFAYFKLPHNLFVTLVLFMVALFVGITSASRGVFLLLIAPALISFTTSKQKYKILMLYFAVLVGFLLITNSKLLIYNNVGGMVVSTDLTIWELFFESIEMLFNADFMQQAFRIARVFEPIESLLLASGYQASSVVDGELGIFYRVIYSGFFPIDNDSHHLQWVGFVPPEGFVFTGRIVSTAIILFNNNFILFFLLTLWVSFNLFLIDHFLPKILMRFNIFHLHNYILLTLLAIFFILYGTGVYWFTFGFISLLLFLIKFIDNFRGGCSRPYKKTNR
jgi:hypothetical protein